MLPLPGTVVVAVGDLVRSDQVVARAELPGKVFPVNLANQLSVAPSEIKDYLIKKEGDVIGKDEILAENKPLIKWFKTEIRSPVAGTIESVSSVTGQVLLREPPRVLQLLAYVNGTIIETIPQQGVVVETMCSLVQGIFGHFNSAMKDKVVVGGSFLSAEAMKQAKAVGVAGLVVGGIHDEDLRALLGYDLGVAITGTEQVGFTLILTEGFGTIPMAAKTFKLLSSHVGQKASISGATQIRAGVIRPEIIIPQERTSTKGAAQSQREGIRLGDPVRIIRDPMFGRIGEVSALPSGLTKIPTESEVRVLEVKFADGQKAVIPRTNIEVIEGA
jgi:hypothetical protein